MHRILSTFLFVTNGLFVPTLFPILFILSIPVNSSSTKKYVLDERL
jgi:hypothetical protein